MAKSKKNIGAFQKAMLSNTKMIGTEDSMEKEKANSTKSNSKLKNEAIMQSVLKPAVYKKFEEIGKKHGIETDVLIEKGLNLFLSLEHYWFDNND